MIGAKNSRLHIIHCPFRNKNILRENGAGPERISGTPGLEEE
jgi:hypothetical protein